MSGIIDIQNLFFSYLPGTPYEKQALKDINISLQKGEFWGIFGPNGSGKSTLAQLLNGLLPPGSGQMTVCGLDANNRGQRRELWKKVALVFQYPEQQIFQLTVYDEIAYGLRNLKICEGEVRERVYRALMQVGLEPEKLGDSSPFTLSGGVKRRIAIAGMLALEPEILVLDEPMAGLDPLGRKLISAIIKSRQERQETSIMISHNLKDILPLADKTAILDEGSLVFMGSTAQLSEDKALLSRYNLEIPEHLQLIYALSARGYKVPPKVNTMQEAGELVIQLLS